MVNEYYDFKPGRYAIKRMFFMILVRIVSRVKLKNEYSFFTDGIGYIDQQITADGQFEKGLIGHILTQSKKHSKQKLYVDIGANIGNHAVSVASNFDMVAAYEPHPVLFRILQANLLSNDVDISQTYNFGLGAKDEEATLLQSTGNHGLSKVAEKTTMSSGFFGFADEDFDRSFKIKLKDSIKELEKYNENLNEAFIKIDVEGMEAEILKSMLPLFKKYRPIVAVEWAPSEQPKLELIFKQIKGFKIMGCFIRQSENRFIRFIMNIIYGRKYVLEEIDFGKRERLYPLVFLIPEID